MDVRVVQASGVTALGRPKGPGEVRDFVAQGEARIEVSLAQRGAALAEAELMAVQLTGVVNEAAGSVDFRLKAQARVESVGAPVAVALRSGGVERAGVRRRLAC